MKVAIVANVCFLLEGQQVILARKKRTLGIGLWNGYGGKVEPGESMLDALVREVYEESGVELDLESVTQQAVIRTFLGTEPLFELHVFVARKWVGEPRETDEHGPPQRFEVYALPYEEMFPADGTWLRRIFQDDPFEAEVFLQEDRQSSHYIVERFASFP